MGPAITILFKTGGVDDMAYASDRSCGCEDAKCTMCNNSGGDSETSQVKQAVVNLKVHNYDTSAEMTVVSPVSPPRKRGRRTKSWSERRPNQTQPTLVIFPTTGDASGEKSPIENCTRCQSNPEDPEDMSCKCQQRSADGATSKTPACIR